MLDVLGKDSLLNQKGYYVFAFGRAHRLCIGEWSCRDKSHDTPCLHLIKYNRHPIVKGRHL